MPSMASGASYPNAAAYLYTGAGQALPHFNYDATHSKPHELTRLINLSVNGGQYPVFLDDDPRSGTKDFTFVESILRQTIQNFQTEIEFNFFTPDNEAAAMNAIFTLQQESEPVDSVYHTLRVLPYMTVPMATELTVRNVKIMREKKQVTWQHQGLGYRMHVDTLNTDQGKVEQAAHTAQVVKSMQMMMHLGRVGAIVENVKTPSIRTFFDPSHFKGIENMIAVVEQMFGAMNKRQFGIEWISELVRKFREKDGAGPFEMILTCPGAKGLIALGTNFRLVASNVGIAEARETRNKGSEAITGLGSVPIIEIGPARYQNVNMDTGGSMLENETTVGEYYPLANKFNPPRNWKGRRPDTSMQRMIAILGLDLSHPVYCPISLEQAIENAQCFGPDGLPDYENLQTMLNNLPMEVAARGMTFATDANQRPLIDPFVYFNSERKHSLAHYYGQRSLPYSPERDLDSVAEVGSQTFHYILGEEKVRDLMQLLRIMEDIRHNSVGPKITGITHPLETMVIALAANLGTAGGTRGLTAGNAFGCENLPRVVETADGWVYDRITSDDGSPVFVLVNFPIGFHTVHAMKYIRSLGPDVNGWYRINPKLFDDIRKGVDALVVLEQKLLDAYHDRDAPHYFMTRSNVMLPFYQSIDGATRSQQISTFMQLLLGKVEYPVGTYQTIAARPEPREPALWRRFLQPAVLAYASMWHLEDPLNIVGKITEGCILNRIVGAATVPYLQGTQDGARLINAIFAEFQDNDNKPVRFSGDQALQIAQLQMIYNKHQHFANVSLSDELPVEPMNDSTNIILRIGISRAFFGDGSDFSPIVWPTSSTEGGYSMFAAEDRDGFRGNDALHQAHRNIGHAAAHWAGSSVADSTATFVGVKPVNHNVAKAWSTDAYGEMEGLTLDPLSRNLARDSPDLFTRLKYIDANITCPIGRACAIAYCFARISRQVELRWVRKNMYDPVDYIGIRSSMRFRMGSFFYVSRNIGKSLYSGLRTTTAYNVYLGDVQVSLDLYVSNFVTRPNEVTIMHQCMFKGILGGGSTAIIPPMWKTHSQSSYESVFEASQLEQRHGDIAFTQVGNWDLVMNIVDITGASTKIGLPGKSATIQSFPGALYFSRVMKNLSLLETSREIIQSNRLFREAINDKHDNTTCWMGAIRVNNPDGISMQRTYSAGPLSGITPGCAAALLGLEIFGQQDDIVYGL